MGQGSLCEVLRVKMLKLLSKPWLENDSAALDESIKSLLQFTDDELSELSYGAQNIFVPSFSVPGCNPRFLYRDTEPHV